MRALLRSVGFSGGLRQSQRLSVLYPVTDNENVDVDRLRAETRPEHEATEAALPLMAEDLTLAQYAHALGRLYLVLRGWEDWAAHHAPEQYRNLLLERQRSPLLHQDLAFLQVAPAAASARSVQEQLDISFLAGDRMAAVSRARFLGAMYVVEGSTLGGQYIAKYTGAKFGFPDGRGNAYFRGYGERTGSMWRSFKDELVRLPESDAAEVIDAARKMFGVFASTMSSDSFALGSSAVLIPGDHRA